MPSVVNRHSRRITSVCSLLRPHLWPYSDASSCLIARRSVAFLLRWIKRVWKRCGACSCRTRWPVRDPSRAWEVCGTGKDNDGWSSSLVGTRQAARQRALPQSPDLPPPQRRLQPVCAPGYTGRKRGEVVRTRTTLLQAHTHQWLATFGNAGNADYRGERLARAGGDRGVSDEAEPAPRSGPHPTRWPVREWSHRRGPAGCPDPLADAWQRLRARFRWHR